MAIAIDTNNIVFSKKLSSNSSSRSNSTSISSGQSSSLSSVRSSFVPHSPSPLLLPSSTVSSYSSTTSSRSSTGLIKDETHSISEMLYNLPSVQLVKSMIQGTINFFNNLVNNFIDYLPYSMINHHHHNGITINFCFQFHSILCPFRSRFMLKRINISSTSSPSPSSLSSCSSCSNGQTNKINLPDVIPINDSKRRSNVQFKSSSTLIIDVASTLRDVSNKFNSDHLRLT